MPGGREPYRGAMRQPGPGRKPVWRRTRVLALTVQLAGTPLMRRPYDLDVTGLSTRRRQPRL